jgi:hypothetical protein
MIITFYQDQSYMEPNHWMLPLVPTPTKLSSMSFHFKKFLPSLDYFGLFYIICEWIGIQIIFILKHHSTRPWSVKLSL